MGYKIDSCRAGGYFILKRIARSKMISYNWTKSNTNSSELRLSANHPCEIELIMNALPKLGGEELFGLQTKINAIVKDYVDQQNAILADFVEKSYTEEDIHGYTTTDTGLESGLESGAESGTEYDIEILEPMIEDEFTLHEMDAFYRKLESPHAKRKKQMSTYAPSSMNILLERNIFVVSFQEIVDFIQLLRPDLDVNTRVSIGHMFFIIPCISYDKLDQEFLTYRYMGYETMHCSFSKFGETFFSSCEKKEAFLKMIIDLAIQAYGFLHNTTKWQNDIIPAFDFFDIYQLFVDSRLTNLGGKNTNSPWQQFLQQAKKICKDIISGIISTECFPEKKIKLIQGIVTFKKYESCCRRLINAAFHSNSLYGHDESFKKALFVSRDNDHARDVYNVMQFQDSDLYKYSDFEHDKTQDDEMRFMIMA